MNAALVLRDRVIETMRKHNRCDIEIAVLLRDWVNMTDSDIEVQADFKAWCRKRGWIADRAETVPKMIVTRRMP